MFDLQKSNLQLLYSVWSESKSQEDAQKWLKVTVSEAFDLSTGSFSSPETSSSSLGGKSRTFRSYTFRFLQAAGQPEAPILPWHRVFSLVALPQPMALFLRFVMVFLNFYNGYWFITIYGKYMVNIW